MDASSGVPPGSPGSPRACTCERVHDAVINGAHSKVHERRECDGGCGTDSPPAQPATGLAAAVARGAGLLDQLFPGWLDRVDLDRLDLSDPDGCLLGQMYGSYGLALSVLRISEVTAADYGFQASTRWHPRRQFAVLTAAWRDLITSRRAPAGS